MSDNRNYQNSNEENENMILLNPKKNNINEINKNEKTKEKVLEILNLSDISNENLNTKPIKNLNNIIENSGYNLITFKVIFFTIFFCFCEGFMLIYFGNISSAFKNYYAISDGFLGFIASLTFLGMSIGNSTVHFYQNLMDRRKVILLSALGMLASNSLCALIHNIYSFAIFRLIGSIFLGYYMVLMYSILTEYLPIKFRGFILNIIWFGWNLGVIYFLLICKIYCPNLSYDPLNEKTPQNFNMAIFSFIYPGVLNLILIFFFLKDSPRNLMTLNKKKEAAEILEYYIKRELTEEEIESIYYNIKNSGENKRGKNHTDYRLLFSSRYLRMSILTIIIFFLYSFCLYGMSIAVPIILKYISNSEKEKKDEQPTGIDALLVVYLIISLGPICGGFIAEMRFIGKKFSQIIMLFLSVIFGGFGLIFITNFYILNSISSLFLMACLNLNTSWTAEILPTKLRDLGFGLFQGSVRFGGFISQFVMVAIVNVNAQITIWIYLISLVTIIVMLAFLPRNEIEELDSELDLSASSEEDN